MACRDDGELNKRSEPLQYVRAFFRMSFLLWIFCTIMMPISIMFMTGGVLAESYICYPYRNQQLNILDQVYYSYAYMLTTYVSSYLTAAYHFWNMSLPALMKDQFGYAIFHDNCFVRSNDLRFKMTFHLSFFVPFVGYWTYVHSGLAKIIAGKKCRRERHDRSL